MKICPITVEGFFHSAGVDDLMAEYQRECTVGNAERHPDKVVYSAMEKANVLTVLGVYDDYERIIGFATVTVYPDPRTSVKMAVLDTIYVSEAQRLSGIGTSLLHRVYGVARQAGAEGILIEALCGSRFEELLRLTAKKVRTTFYKQIKE